MIGAVCVVIVHVFIFTTIRLMVNQKILDQIVAKILYLVTNWVSGRVQVTT